MNICQLEFRQFLFCLLMVMFSSCGHRIHKGQVVSKGYEPERTYNYTTPMFFGKIMVQQNHTRHVDANWIIWVKGEYAKDTITEYFYISEVNYKCLNVGDIFNDTIPCSK